METNLQKCAIRREVQNKHSGSGVAGRRGAREEGGSLRTESGVAEGGGEAEKSRGEEGGRSLSQAELAARS